MKHLLTIFLLTLLTRLTMAQSVQHIVLDTLQSKQMSELMTRRTASGSQGTFGLLNMQKGAVVPLHHHINEQYTFILKGSVKLTINNQVYFVKAGECLIIPPNVPHLFESLENDTVDLDFFTPRREDWLSGKDESTGKKQ